MRKNLIKYSPAANLTIDRKFCAVFVAARLPDSARGKPLEVWFQDEAQTDPR